MFLIRDIILLRNNKKAKKYDVYNHTTYTFAENKKIISYHCPPYFIVRCYSIMNPILLKSIYVLP